MQSSEHSDRHSVSNRSRMVLSVIYFEILTHNDKIKTSHTSIEESAEGCSMRRVTEIQPVSAIKLLVEL